MNIVVVQYIGARAAAYLEALIKLPRGRWKYAVHRPDASQTSAPSYATRSLEKVDTVK